MTVTFRSLATGLLISTVIATGAHAQDGGNTFTLGLGVESAPDYFGSGQTSVDPTGSIGVESLKFGSLRLGSGSGPTEGFGFTGSFRYVAERSADDYAELAGLNDVDATIEVGGGLTYTASNFDVFAVARYGVAGHEGFVGELGGDVIARPTDQLELRVGPRLLMGDDTYAQTYFGVTAAEAAASSFAAFDAEGGVLSRGIEASAAYAFSQDWGVKGTIRYDQYQNDAAASPIVQQGSEDNTTMSIVATRRFSF